MHELCSDWHAPYTGSIAPYSLSRGNPLKFTLFRNIHSWICATQRLHARTSLTSYTFVNIYNFNSRLAHFNALWMEYIRSLRTGIMAEYPVMSTSQGTYVRIEQTSEAIRVTYKICRAGGREDWNWEPLMWSNNNFLWSSDSSLPWGAMLNFQWPVWESDSDNTKFNTPAPHSHLIPCNTNESHDTGERKWLIGPNLDIFT